MISHPCIASSNYEHEKGSQLMVVEVKTSVAADSAKLASSDVMKLLIYSQYLTRIKRNIYDMWYINCFTINFSDIAQAKPLLLPFMINGSHLNSFNSFFSIVQLLDGMINIAVWFQMTTKIGGTCFIFNDT